MKVKSMYPIIVSDNPKETISFYENLGFKVKHDATTLKGSHVYVLNNDDLEIEIIDNSNGGPVPMTNGLYGFRMNVDDVDEAYKELKEKGFSIVAGPIDTAMGKNLLIKDNQGINITLIQHIKK